MGPAAMIALVLACGSGASAEGPSAVYDGVDAGRERIELRLTPVAHGLSQPTDVQFPPGRSDVMVVLQKGGEARWISGEASGTLFRVDPATPSEMGLLGLAFHPAFAENGRMYVNWNPDERTSRISEVVAPGGDLRAGATVGRTVMQVAQPYVNHDAGQLAFGPDGMLYVGWGDGGAGGDPGEVAQDGRQRLGKMLRIDVSTEPYAVPPDNPFIGRSGFLPEIWAYGIRNPWRFSFDPKGRVVLADVGQNAWEEVDLVAAGDNLGWDAREGRHCHEPKQGCASAGMVDPIWEYGRDAGQSITGGYVATGDAAPALKGRYVFGDFVSGRIWAMELPDAVRPVEAVSSLGRWPISPSTFGRDARGDLYVADFRGGVVYRLEKP